MGSQRLTFALILICFSNATTETFFKLVFIQILMQNMTKQIRKSLTISFHAYLNCNFSRI